MPALQKKNASSTGNSEFPEVFYGPRRGTTQAIERLQGAGFDAVIGNPPWGASFDSCDKAFTKDYFSTTASVSDSYLAFTERGATHARQGGLLGFIIPDAWLSGIKYRGFRQFLTSENRIRVSWICLTMFLKRLT